MNESLTAVYSDNDAAWRRLVKLFDHRQRPVVVWVGGNSQAAVMQYYRRFRERFASKFEHVEVPLNRLEGHSLYAYLTQLSASKEGKELIFHLLDFPENNELLLSQLNFERELFFKRLRASVVFWGDDAVEVALQRFAPDFWDWLVYCFRFDAVLSAAEEVPADGRSVPSAAEKETWEARAERLHRRLQYLRPNRDRGGRHTLDYAETALSLGRALAYLARLSEARTLFDEAIELYRKEQDDLGRAYALLYLGELERRLGQLERARNLLDEAIELYRKVQDDLGRAHALRNLGELESRLGQLARARNLLDEAIELYRKEQHDLGRANALQSKGNLLLKEERFVEALDVYRQALALYQREQEPMGAAYTAAEILRCLHASGNGQADEMQQLAEHSMTMALASGVPSVVGYVISCLVEVGVIDPNDLGQ